MFVNGHWEKNWRSKRAESTDGRFVHPPSIIRNWITSDGRPLLENQGPALLVSLQSLNFKDEAQIGIYRSQALILSLCTSNNSL